jgi:hypothetical protein
VDPAGIFWESESSIWCGLVSTAGAERASHPVQTRASPLQTTARTLVVAYRCPSIIGGVDVFVLEGRPVIPCAAARKRGFKNRWKEPYGRWSDRARTSFTHQAGTFTFISAVVRMRAFLLCSRKHVPHSGRGNISGAFGLDSFVLCK